MTNEQSLAVFKQVLNIPAVKLVLNSGDIHAAEEGLQTLAALVKAEADRNPSATQTKQP